ncbi:MAG: glycosyltransferase family 2 protein [Prevotella sp.]|nr:glycosyltransferase family 2 protein [Prevotella sp.]
MNEEIRIFTTCGELLSGVMSGVSRGRWTALQTQPGIIYKENAWSRLTGVAEAVGAAMIYCDRYECGASGLVLHPVTDYQAGSLRDDFDFGSVLVFRTELVRGFAETCGEARRYKYSGLYALRLWLARQGLVFHLPEALYTAELSDERTSGERQFDYINPANGDVQRERELAVTFHLREINALVRPGQRLPVDLSAGTFPVGASVVIPVRNRVRTIRDAVESALTQQCPFEYNVIVVDNHSTDGTTDILRRLAAEDKRVRLIIPERDDLSIGGCWNRAVNDAACGRFAVQLDSDDLYSSPKTLQTIVDAFYAQGAAMVIGSYRVCDFGLNTLAPGLVSHAEWSDANGANNALRVNGLGAPRAFFTPLLRSIPFPDVSYGEDYAVGLAVSRRYKIGRIYDELYLCRRWEGNSDAVLTAEQTNRNNIYKDRLRTIELAERIKLNTSGDV